MLSNARYRQRVRFEYRRVGVFDRRSPRVDVRNAVDARLGEVDQAVNEWEELREKARNSKIIEIVKHRIQVAKEWEKVLQEY